MTDFTPILKDPLSVMFFAATGIYLLVVLKVVVVNVLLGRHKDGETSEEEN